MATKGIIDDPNHYSEAITNVRAHDWQEVIISKIESMYLNQVYTLENLHPTQKRLDVSVSTRKKRDCNGMV